MDYSQVRLELETLLNTLTGTGNPLQVVYPYVKPISEDGYPSAMISSIAPGEEVSLDSVSNLTSAEVAIRILVQNKNQEDNERILQETLTEVEAELRKKSNCSLNNSVDWLQMLGRENFFSDEAEPVRGVDIRIRVNKRNTII